MDLARMTSIAPSFAILTCSSRQSLRLAHVVRRVIVDLMLSLFAMIFMIAVVSSDKLGNQPKSKNFIVVSSNAKDNAKNQLTITPKGQSSVDEVQAIQGYPDSAGNTTIVYTQFPAPPGVWLLTNKATEKRTVQVLTRSGRKALELSPGDYKELVVSP